MYYEKWGLMVILEIVDPKINFVHFLVKERDKKVTFVTLGGGWGSVPTKCHIGKKINLKTRSHFWTPQ